MAAVGLGPLEAEVVESDEGALNGIIVGSREDRQFFDASVSVGELADDLATSAKTELSRTAWASLSVDSPPRFETYSGGGNGHGLGFLHWIIATIRLRVVESSARERCITKSACRNLTKFDNLFLLSSAKAIFFRFFGCCPVLELWLDCNIRLQPFTSCRPTGNSLDMESSFVRRQTVLANLLLSKLSIEMYF